MSDDRHETENGVQTESFEHTYVVRARCPACREVSVLGYETDDPLSLMEDVPLPPHCPACGVRMDEFDGWWDVIEDHEVVPTEPTDPGDRDES